MEQIYLKIKKIVEDFSIRYNIRLRENILKINKSLLNKNKNKKRVKFSNEIDNNRNRNKDMGEINENNYINKTKDEDNKKESNEKNKKVNNNINDDIISRKSNINEKESKSYSKISKLSINLLNNNEEKRMNKSNCNNTKISIVKNNSFLIIKSSEKTIDEYKNNDFEINKKESFTIKCRSVTIKKESKESIKVNESYNELIDSAIPKKEDIFYKEFINLDSTKENSFKLDSSYENINKISNNKYINDILLQNKIKQFIIKECSDKDLSKNEPQYVHSPTHNQDIKRISNHLIANINPEENLKYNKSLNKKFFSRKSKTIDKIDKVNINRRNSLALVSPNKLDKKINQINRYNSGRNSAKLRRSNFYSPNKIKRKLTKKKLIIVNKKLNAITKNIENTNNAINNPNEFYTNFFNNILNKKKSFDVDIKNKVYDSKKEKEKEINNINKIPI